MFQITASKTTTSIKREASHQFALENKYAHRINQSENNITFDVPVTNCKSLAMSSLLYDLTTSQNQLTTVDAVV